MGVVSLTMGNFPLPLAHRLVGDMQLTGQLFLGQLVLFAQLLEKAAEGRILHGGTTFVLCVHSIAEGGENGNRREVEAVGNQQ